MKKEVQKQEKVSRSDQSFKKPQFEQAMEILESIPDIDWKQCYPAMTKFQFHLIVRLDKTCHVKRDTLMLCFQFPFALMVRLR
eukprot:4464494-Ditylum_brightwellii.AAC.1